MKMAAELGEAGKAVHQLLGEVLGIRGGEAEAGDTGNPGHRPQQLREGPAGGLGLIQAVGVDVLSDQGHLLDAVGGQMADLVDDVIETAADLPPSGERHHAVCTKIVATLHDGDEPLVGRSALHGGQERGDDKGLRLLDRHLLTKGGLGDQVGQFIDMLGADHQVHKGHPVDDFPAFLLGHAAGHRHHQTGSVLFEHPHPPEQAVDLLLGLVADGAGVDHHHVGQRDFRGAGIGLLGEELGHDLRVALVHLAAKGFYVGESFWMHHLSVMSAV